MQAINGTLEGRTEKLKNPFDPASLAWYAWIAARLGGWSGYTSKGYKPAGPKTMAAASKSSMPWSKDTCWQIVPHLPDSRSPQGEGEPVSCKGVRRNRRLAHSAKSAASRPARVTIHDNVHNGALRNVAVLLAAIGGFGAGGRMQSSGRSRPHFGRQGDAGSCVRRGVNRALGRYRPPTASPSVQRRHRSLPAGSRWRFPAGAAPRRRRQRFC